jgi:drug/metabolite transporter (DMT)-like permease
MMTDKTKSHPTPGSKYQQLKSVSDTFPEIRNEKIDVAVGFSSHSILLSCFWASVWFGTGVTMTIFLKKLSAPEIGFQFMCTLTMIHFLFQWTFLRGVFVCTNFFGEYQRAKPEHWRPIVGVGLYSGFGVAITNFSFSYLSLGCQTILKNLTPLAIYLVACFIGVEKWRVSLVSVIMVMCLACMLTVSDVRASLSGVIMALLAVGFAGCKCVTIQTLGGHYKSMQQMALTQPFAALSLMPYVAFFEAPHWSSAAPLPFMGYVYAGGTVVFSILLTLSMFQIAVYTSATTLGVLGNARGLSLILYGAFVFGESEEYSIFG